MHVVPRAPEHHGVIRCARELAAATGAEVRRPSLSLPADARQHVHFTDRLFGESPESAAEAIVRLCAAAPTTLTLHDVPQPGDGPSFSRRRDAYARVVRHAAGWVTNSHHERTLLTTHTLGGSVSPAGAVIPLAVTAPTSPREVDAPTSGAVAVLGWVYPGKGHHEVITAAASLSRPVDVVALGAVTPGHEAVSRELAELADGLGVRFAITGALTEQRLAHALTQAAVGVAAHRNLSASGSLNTWISAGRRPLVRDSPYAREMTRLRPGSLTLVSDGGLASALRLALEDPASTVLDQHAVTAPHLDAVAASYLAWWAR